MATFPENVGLNPFSAKPFYIFIYPLYHYFFFIISTNIFIAGYSRLEIALRAWPSFVPDLEPNLYLMFEFSSLILAIQNWYQHICFMRENSKSEEIDNR